jgi:hypothetical protein
MSRPSLNSSSLRHGQRGLALVEAAIVLPLLLLLLLPVVEFGRAFIQYSTLAHHGRRAYPISVRHLCFRRSNWPCMAVWLAGLSPLFRG